MRTRTLVVALAVMIAVGLFAAAPVSQASANGYNVHCVRYGETLYSIAWKYGTSAHAIAQYNGLWNPNYIHAGQCLRIPAGYGGYGGYSKPNYGNNHMGYGGYTKPSTGYGHAGYGGYTMPSYDHGYKKPAYGHGGYGNSYGGKYCVRYGDTLSKIAAHHGTSAWAIAQANGIYNPNWVRAGQCLSIPGYRY